MNAALGVILTNLAHMTGITATIQTAIVRHI